MTKITFAEFYYNNYFKNSELFSKINNDIKDYSDKIKCYYEKIDKMSNEEFENYSNNNQNEQNIIDELEIKLKEMKKNKLKKNIPQRKKIRKICKILNYYSPFIFKSCTDNNYRLDEFDLNSLIKSELIASEVDYEDGHYYNETYLLRLCLKLYKVDKYYIHIDFSKQNYMDGINPNNCNFDFLNKTCTVYQKNEYNNLLFLDNVVKFRTVLQFFKNIYPIDEYKLKLYKYIDQLYA